MYLFGKDIQQVEKNYWDITMGHSNIFLPVWLSLLPVYSHFLPLTSWKAEAPYLQGDGMIQY